MKELRGVTPRVRLGPGAHLVRIPAPFERWASRVLERRPIFVRHVCPADVVAAIDDGLDAFEHAVATLVDRIDPQSSFAAQVQLVGEVPIGRHAMRSAAHGVVSSLRDVEISIADPVQVMSIVVTATHAYIGVSPARLNLSSWPGGMRRFAREPGQISRSEFKLLEALEAFSIELDAGARALDLGAAPGGWTRVLADRGLDVVAVDPADLDPRLHGRVGVTHLRERVQEFVRRRDGGTFSFVANDMRMDARDSARIMRALDRKLSPEGGHAVMTLKLPRAKAVGVLRAALEILRSAYDVRGVRQLFHNRHEVTAHLAWTDN